MAACLPANCNVMTGNDQSHCHWGLLAGEVVTKYKVSYIGAPSPITLDTRASNEGLRILFYNHLLESTYQHLSYDL